MFLCYDHVMKTSRRSAVAALAGITLVPREGRSASKEPAFGLIGDRYHNSDYIRVALNRTITKDLGIGIDFCDETKLLTAETLRGYKLLIILRDGMIWPDGYPDETTNAGWLSTGKPKLVSDPTVPPTAAKSQFWMNPEQGKAVRHFVEDGGSALFLHNVTHVGLTDPDFRHVLGAAYSGHPPIRTFKVKVTNPDHPITNGVRDFIVTDEQHYMEYDKDPKYLLLETVNEEGLTYQKLGSRAPGGWAYDYGKGRVCYFSPGHMVSVLWNPEYVKLQHNAVRWLLRQTG
jgi:type 1 glutamine amidotransferase